MKEVTTLSPKDLERVLHAASIIENNLKYHYRIPELAEKLLINKNKLKEDFKTAFGMGLYGWLLQKRLEKARELLLADVTIRTIAISVGFIGYHAETNFIKFFKKICTSHPPPGAGSNWRIEG
ncbi:AraC family transcriptional regulator [Paraflavitalea speifideaquila]|uniref:helix-turn-helix domain-containing protein n=1 Tax=Paraflavitalea speifideaquila TaxID=3076558 RepID=UPI0028E94EB0|nr:AraC family transcriptional regulator [Paraflavitalea speifideiaquila]